MNIKLHITYFFLFTALCLTKTNASDINYQLLEPRAGNLSSRILSGEVITSDSIASRLDFIPYDRRPIGCEPEKFLDLIGKVQPTIESATEKLGHNRFGIFVKDCQTLFDKGQLENKDSFALFILLRHVLHKINCALLDIDTTVESESRIPDEQFSFLFDSDQVNSRAKSEESAASTQHISSCGESFDGHESKSIISDEHDDVLFTSVSLDGRALQPSSFTHYSKKLPDNDSPLCITCNLQSIKKDEIQTLTEAIKEIDKNKSLREILFTNGSSIKFNLLFPFFEKLSQNRTEKCTQKNPIRIIYSTTSDSQKAYMKLSTLSGIIHESPDVRDLEDITKIQRESIHNCQRIKSDFSNDSFSKIKNVLGSTAVSKLHE